MKTRILYVLQQSIYDNTGKWLTADSNINMMVGMLGAMSSHAEFWNNVEIDVLISPISDFADIESYDEICKYDNVKFIEFPFIVDAFMNRQNFSVRDWEPILKSEYHIIINNIPELSRNIKTILEVHKLHTKLVTQCFWLDAPEIGEPKVPTSYSYDWRQFDGFECSHLSTFTCKSTRDAFFENAKLKFASKYIDSIENKYSIWDFGYSQSECDFYNTDNSIVKSDKVTIGFLNRLSGINYTHHEEFIKAVNILADKRDDFRVILTNPSKKVDSDWMKSNIKAYREFNRDLPLDRSEYWAFLNSCDITVHLFTIERYGGCALRESIAAGNIPIVANCNEQKDLIAHKDFLVDIREDGNISIDDLVSKLSNAIDLIKSKKSIDIQNEIKIRNEQRCSFEKVIETVINDLNKLRRY